MRRIGGGDEEGQFRYVDRFFSIEGLTIWG
jgi:hypothetical protein